MKHTFDKRDEQKTYCVICQQYVKGKTPKEREAQEDCKE